MAAKHQQEQCIGYGVMVGAVGLVTIAIVGFAVWYGVKVIVPESARLETGARNAETIVASAILAEHVAKGMERVIMEDGAVIGYFTDGELNLAEGGLQRLQDMLSAVSAEQTVVVTGYDGGEPAAAEAWRYKQMMVLKNVLMGWGVPEVQITLRTVRDPMMDTGVGQLVVSLE